jgi:hypothetical protein
LDVPNDLPLVFANRVIRQFVDNMFGAGKEISDRDYMVLRVVFRHTGGSWTQLIQGDVRQLTVLEKLIQTWGQNA